MRLTHMSFRERVGRAAAPVVAMALIVAACGGGAGDTDVVADDAAGDASSLGTIVPLESTEADTGAGTGTGESTVSEAEQPSEDETSDDTTAGEATQDGGTVAVPSDSPLGFAMTDLAGRMDVPVADVVLVSQEEVMWRDGSLGCPQPGFSYTQALVDGYKIILEVGGITYAYHGQAGRDPFLCENDLAAEKSGSPITLEPKVGDTGTDLEYDDGADD